MTNQASQFPRFYVTASSDCPYIKGRQERKIFTELSDNNPGSLHDSLALIGFRRSQDIAYRPACENCTACISVRVPTQTFKASRSQRKLIIKNDDISFEVVPNIASREQYTLLKQYLKYRHPDGGMTDMKFAEYMEMVECSPINTQLIEYRLPCDGSHKYGRLVGVALTDSMLDSISMVYSFYDPCEALKGRSLGTYIILHHISWALIQKMKYVYLGYWVKNSPKMAYKEKFRPQELLGQDGWMVKE